MLKQLGDIIEKRPWLVVTVVLLITIGFGTLIPSLEMETSTEDFMPDNEIVNAGARINEYFGQTGEIIIIYVEKQNAKNVVTPQALKEEYRVLKELSEQHDKIDGSISVAAFVDIICQIEFGETLLNCTDNQILIAYNDMMSKIQTDELMFLETDDKNEEIDFDPHPNLLGGKSIDSLDIKNYYLNRTDDTFIFSIETYNLSEFSEKISSPHRRINTWEWYIDFENLIVPDKMLADMSYQIAAHVEPSKPLWNIGKGILNNIKEIFNNIREGQLFNSYKSEAYLWIKAPGQNISFPLALETGNVTFNTAENRVEIEVDREELGKFGIAPQFGGAELPAKISNTNAGVRIYQSPVLNKPWNRVVFNVSYIENLIEKIQNGPIIGPISERVLSRFSNFSWEDFDELFEMLNSEEFSVETLSLKDISDNWKILDEAPDTGKSDAIYFFKPLFIEDLKKSTIAFLSDDYDENSGPSLTLMMVYLNGTIGYMQVGPVSGEIEETLMSLDNQEKYVSMKATGSGIISNDMDELTTEANIIIMPAAFFVICLILLIMFKRLSYVFLPLLGLSISVIWLFGSMVLLGISFNMMMVAIVPLLLGLGVDYSVHLFHNYKSELKKGKRSGDAIKNSLRDVGLAMFLATLTTVFAFLSFLSATVPPLRDFGILCALGISFTLVNALTFQAAVRYILDRKKSNEKLVSKSNNRISLQNNMERFSNVVLKHRKKIILITVLATIILAFGAVQVETTFDMNDFLPEGNESMDLMMNIDKYFPSTSQEQEYILIEGDVASVETLEGMSKTYENLKDDKYITFTIDGEPKQASILSVIQTAVRDNSTLITEFNIGSDGIPKSDGDVKKLYDYLYDHNEYMMQARGLIHKDGNVYDAAVIIVYTDISYANDGEVDTTTQAGILFNQLNEDMEDYGDTESIVTGMSSSMYTIMNSMTDSQILSTIISVILAALVLIIVFRNPILGIITILPVGLCIIWIVGTIYLLGYSFNIMTIMVTSLTIGIGIDYAIHATQRFRLTADRTGDVEKAVTTTIGHTGGALFIAALTTAVGFGLLILAPMPPEQQFGLITAMTIIYSYIASIVVLPPILMKWGKWRKNRKGFIISPNPPKED
ncbi:MAG: hypothetical protein BV457_05620 [Thermoplasmata archaeon M9B1D]|nr:MAG: hypothetical protein BV457_05620 [Thermoplasmata archaeon M9B1D]